MDPLVIAGIVVLVLAAALVLFISTRPALFRVERSAVVKAPADVIFAIINDLHQWGRWSPYDKRDPAMTKTFEGSPAGVGAVYMWNGNNQVGAGRFTIVESRPNELIGMKLEFFRPFAGTNRAAFALAPADGGTRVTWSMEGPNKLMTKVMSLFINMDKMIGTDFEQGLANLDSVAQAEAQAKQTR